LVAEACGNRLYLFHCGNRFKGLREGQISGAGYSHNQTPLPDPAPASRLANSNLDFSNHQSMLGRDFLSLSP
jgi:hypothetical protein